MTTIKFALDEAFTECQSDTLDMHETRTRYACLIGIMEHLVVTLADTNKKKAMCVNVLDEFTLGWRMKDIEEI